MPSTELTAPSIEEIELPAGARKLKRRQPAGGIGPGGEMPGAHGPRLAARIITIVWGDRYFADLLSFTVPALLAPGNLPAFAGHFDCEFVIVTETRLFDRISRSPAIFQLLGHCDVRMVPIDDLLSPWYGITLTYALVRGFADLGAEMVNAHLVFLNADFIIADGSFAKLAEVILRGERLVVSPSYCMVHEDAIDRLRAHYDAKTQMLSVRPRDLAAIIIAHRHNTVRAKTANQRLFRIHRYDQFYWYVDEHTLLARQMPIAVVYMRPERVLTELPTFWDYGVISEYCPTVTPCVLGDSDDFLMAELRTEGSFADLLHLGWPDVGEIAAYLSSFTTKDHRDYGRHTLMLHSADVPPQVGECEAAFGAFVDQVYARLSAPVAHVNHPFWASTFPRFLAAQIDQRGQRERQEQARAALLRQDPLAPARHRRIAQLRSRIRDIAHDPPVAGADTGAGHRSIDLQLAELDAEYRNQRRAIEEKRLVRETAKKFGADQLAELESELASLISEEEGQLDAFRGDVPLNPESEAALKAAENLTVARLARLYQRVFGQVPHTTKWHPYHTILQPARAAITTAGDVGDVLLITSGGTLGPLLVKDLPGRKLTITPKMVSAGLYNDMIGNERKFGLCVCEFAFNDLFLLRDVLDRIRRLLTERCRIVVFHYNDARRYLDESAYSFTRDTFPLFGRSRISFAGSRAGAFAVRLFDRALNRPASRWQLPVLAMGLGLCAPFARLAAQVEARRSPQRLPRHCTSMTIEIEFG